tara:strand:+ start:195 stop:611 length:417 start_codon:yes stop_codon:yes gene_type:complete
MTPEAKVKKKVAARLKTLGAYYFYPVTGGYGKSGVPDIIGCYEGKFFGIECKAGKNKPTPLQEKNLSDIKANDGISLVINEDNIDDVLVYIGGKHHDPRQLELDFGDSPALKLNDARLWASRRSLIQLERTRNRGKQK